MEKLVELLYEYQKIKCFYPLYYDVEENKIYLDSDAIIGAEQYLISKEFGFIKRLIDNKKINVRRVEVRPFCDDRTEREFPNHIYEMELMLLAISEKPIDSLCKMLN